jgi:uncharacterized protein YqjF (DUF2071 family)
MTGNWEDLVVSTFEVNKSILESYLPKNTEIDFYHGKALMSMVAFTFSKVKFFGIKIPFHQHFGQINFRFYVKSKIDGAKGVVFIKEFAPKWLITLTANLFYNEPYFYKSITQNISKQNSQIKAEYRYKKASINVTTTSNTNELIENTLEHFVVDRYIAFIKNRKQRTFQYKISHKPWKLYKIKDSKLNNDILKLLPLKFKNLKHVSTCFVDGSAVTVQKGILQ